MGYRSRSFQHLSLVLSDVLTWYWDLNMSGNCNKEIQTGNILKWNKSNYTFPKVFQCEGQALGKRSVCSFRCYTIIDFPY